MAIAALALNSWTAGALACPFCTAPQATLAERRDAAQCVALVEWTATAQDGTHKPHEQLRVIKLLKSPADFHPEYLELPADPALRTSGLWLAFGRSAAAGRTELEWQLEAVDELSLAYFARLPSTRLPAQERLVYFCRYLESRNRLVADDVYAEFGRAPFDEVARLAASLPMASLRGWLLDPSVPETRKGFYGMALGLATSADDRTANAACLQKVLLRPGSDFRAGFDGVLAGYLLLDGESALEDIDRRLLSDPRAPLGDVLHAMTALRFYHEYGHAISARRLSTALAHLLRRPEVAPPAIVDLARWQAWECMPQVVSAAQPGQGELALQRSIVGYLLVCPLPEAAGPLAAWRRASPELVAEVERGLSPLNRQ